MTKVTTQTVEFLGLRFQRINAENALTAVWGLSQDDRFSYVVTPNVDHVVRLHRQRDDPILWRAYEHAALTLCDSRVLKFLAHRSGKQLDLVTGSDLTARLLDTLNEPYPVAVVGGTPSLLKDLRALYPDIAWMHHDAPHGVLESQRAQQEIVEFIERCPARLTFFAIGAPQSELVCSQIQVRGTARGVALCCGASLEFVTGAKARAPLWMQRAGLEWLFRLGSEPRRLWRRYLVEGPQIFVIWMSWKFNSAR